MLCWTQFTGVLRVIRYNFNQQINPRYKEDQQEENNL
jgi:hypothetical protein